MKGSQTLVTLILLIIVVFTIGIALGNTYRSTAASESSQILKTSELEAESFLVESELFESFDTNCAIAEKRLTSLNLDLWKLGKILGDKDAKERLGDKDYDYLKRKYHLTQIRTYILDKKLQTDCGNGANVILYYFKQDDPQGAQQGKVLDELVKEYPLHVFAIEYGYSKELKFLEDYYKINITPSLVVNYETVLSGFIDSQHIAQFLSHDSGRTASDVTVNESSQGPPASQSPELRG